MSVAQAARYRLEDLRRHAAGLAAALGVAPARASALASHLLWFDLAGCPRHGLATLPGWLERFEGGAVDPKAEGRPRLERPGTATLDAGNGPAPLILERAAGIAGEKARAVGIGMVRVTRLGPSGPATPAAAELAIGPFLAGVVGPDGSWSIALPTDRGLPRIFDPALVDPTGSTPNPAPPPPGLAAIAGALGGEGGWAILAVAVQAFEPLADFRARMAAAGLSDAPGLDPDAWGRARLDGLDRGLAPDDPTLDALRGWADRLGVDPLGPPPAP